MDALRRHLRIGGHAGAIITECDCPLSLWERELLRRLKKDQMDLAMAKGDSPPLCALAFTAHKQFIRLALEKGYHINAIDVQARGVCRSTALQGAAASDKPKRTMIRYLLEAGADANFQGGYYGTALQAAATSHVDSTKVVEFLLQAGTDVNGTGGRYGTPLQAALFFGNERIAKILIDAGASMAVDEK